MYDAASEYWGRNGGARASRYIPWINSTGQHTGRAWVGGGRSWWRQLQTTPGDRVIEILFLKSCLVSRAVNDASMGLRVRWGGGGRWFERISRGLVSGQSVGQPAAAVGQSVGAYTRVVSSHKGIIAYLLIKAFRNAMKLSAR